MHRKIAFLLTALACLRAWAQQPPELSEVVVTATRIDSSLQESPNAVTVITPADIAAPGAHDVAAVLNGHAGVTVNDYGPIGANKTVSLRGSTSQQVIVLLDGVRLNSSRDGSVDLSTIPIEMVERIEIVRGGASALYGTGGIGGVINIITKKPQKPQVTLSVTNGSYIPHGASEVSASLAETRRDAQAQDLLDSQIVDLTLAGRIGELALSGGGSFTRAANAFTWFDASGIDGWRRRTDADVLSGSGYVGLDAPLFGGRLAAKGVFGLSDAGAPGSLTFVSTTARQSDASGSGALSWKTDRFFGDALTLDVKSFYKHDVLTYDDPTYPPESTHRTRTAGLDVTQKLTLSPLLSMVYGGNLGYDDVDSTNYTRHRTRLSLAGFVSVPVSPTDTLTITPTGRYDSFSDFSGRLSGSLSAVALLSEQSSLRASVASSYRVPTLNDLYWFDPSGFTAANPDLTPETSYAGEVGYSFVGDRASFDVSAFARAVFDNIIWLVGPAPTYTYMPENLTRTLFPGAEIHARLQLTDTFSLEASYTFLYSFLLNDGEKELGIAGDRRVPYSPVHSLAVRIRYTASRWEAGIAEQYVGRQYTNSANTEASSLAEYFVANADCRFLVTENVTLTMAAKNIFNALYSTQLGYPMPPFSLETGVRLSY